MSRGLRWIALVLAVVIALAPGLAFARAGGGGSFGSRGGRTYFAPPVTNTAPYTASPFQRSITPPPAYNTPGAGFGGGYNRGFGNRSPFVTGLLGGLVGAGIGGLLFGGGLFHGISGFGGLLGLLIQLALIYVVVRWIWRRVAGGGGMMAASGPGLFARGGGFGPAASQGGGMPRPGMGQPFGAPPHRVQIGPADYQAFEQILKDVQAAWSRHDLRALQPLATPEMVSVFADQMNEQASRGLRNVVEDVRLESGDLAEAWAEPGREYATVAMRFSMVDVTRDVAGRVVDGSPVERVLATEVWTFVRSPGGRWLLSGIQQTR